MKKPRTINICGKTYKVTYDRKCFDSSGRTGPQIMLIGTRYGKSERIFENVVHESAELIMCERDFRYDAGNNAPQFIMSHGQFSTFCEDLATALYPMVKGRNSE